MEWIKINPKKLPKGEVLAANFKSETYGYKEKLLGSLNHECGIIVCDSAYEQLENCTHYIDIHKFDIKI